jgi:hypothetical protein
MNLQKNNGRDNVSHKYTPHRTSIALIISLISPSSPAKPFQQNYLSDLSAFVLLYPDLIYKYLLLPRYQQYFV